MRKILTAAVLSGACLFNVNTAFAQGAPPPGAPAPSHDAHADEADKKFGVGGDLLFLIPLGDLGNATGPQIGPVARFGYRVIPNLELTGRIGYLLGLKKDIAA